MQLRYVVIGSSFFKRLQTVIDFVFIQTLHKIGYVGWLMSGGNNRSYALNKPVNFTYRFLFKNL